MSDKRPKRRHNYETYRNASTTRSPIDTDMSLDRIVSKKASRCSYISGSFTRTTLRTINLSMKPSSPNFLRSAARVFFQRLICEGKTPYSRDVGLMLFFLEYAWSTISNFSRMVNRTLPRPMIPALCSCYDELMTAHRSRRRIAARFWRHFHLRAETQVCPDVDFQGREGERIFSLRNEFPIK